MTTRARKLLNGISAVIIVYFGAYFASVRTSLAEGKAVLVPIPLYRPFDGGFVQAVFTPAHLIDAAYFRRTHWEARNRTT